MSDFYITKVEEEECCQYITHISTSFRKALKRVPDWEAWDGYGNCRIEKVDEDLSAYEAWEYENSKLVKHIVYNWNDFEFWDYKDGKLVNHGINAGGKIINLMWFDENKLETEIFGKHKRKGDVKNENF